MKARRPTGYRAGHLAEGMGLELFRRLAAVAPVPLAEDVGLDAVCTLLKPSGRRLLADRTFALQVKAVSVKRIPLTAEAFAWLQALEVPLFLARVDLRGGRIAVLTTEWLHSQPSSFGDGPRYILLDNGGATPGARIPPGYRPLRVGGYACWLGPPILEFSFAEADSPGFAERTVPLLSQWVTTATENIRLRASGVYRGVRWQTGAAPDPHGLSSFGGDGALRQVLSDLSPLLWRLDGLLGVPMEAHVLSRALDEIYAVMIHLGIPAPGAVYRHPETATQVAPDPHDPEASTAAQEFVPSFKSTEIPGRRRALHAAWRSDQDQSRCG